MICKDDLVIWLIVHNAVEAGADLDLLDHSQRLQIEHSDRLVAAVRREAVTRLGGDAGAMHTRGVLDVAEYFACGAFDHHHVAGTRNKHPPCGGFDGDIIRASVALDVELFNLERLCEPDVGHGKADCKDNRKRGQ